MSDSNPARRSQTYPFPGGFRTDPNKAALTCDTVDVPLPKRLYLPLLGYRGRPLTPVLDPGATVLAGQTVALGAGTTHRHGPLDAAYERLAASTSGRLIGIDHHAILSPVMTHAPCLVIEPDGEHRIAADLDWRQAGLHGLGGAGFDLMEKIAALAAHRPTPASSPLAEPTDRPVTLLINAAECEPEIASDEALMQRDAATIVAGILALHAALGATCCRIGIESGKVRAIDALTAALDACGDAATPVELVRLPDRYPGGAESVLVRQLTGHWLAAGEPAASHGILCVNIATAHAIGAIHQGGYDGRRILTIAGDRARRPCTARAWLGTPLTAILSATGNTNAPAADPESNTLQAWYGGSYSGYPLPTTGIALTAELNAVLLRSQTAPAAPPRPCIRCTLCEDVCPVALQPQQLYRHARTPDADALARHAFERCIACGCCDRVCPSQIPLTATFRHARSAIAQHAETQRLAERAAHRYAAHSARQQKRQEAREAAIAARKRALATTPSASDLQAALARARQRRKPDASS